MNLNRICITAALFAISLEWASGESFSSSTNQIQQSSSIANASEAESGESAKRANKRYKEMLDKMQAAVEEIAQLYGNPVFLQVFTNDVEQANELKLRLNSAKTGNDIRQEISDLEKRLDELKSDIALKEREANRLASKLVRQRSALDALSTAMEQARTAVEETAK